MALEIKPACEKCRGRLAMDEEAYICSYECTFCAPCARKMKFICPNCGGKLVCRPLRKSI